VSSNDAGISNEQNLEDSIAAPATLGRESIPSGVRILAPTGEVGFVPEENLEDAIAAGARVLTPADMRELRQAVFMEHSLFKHKNQAPQKRKRRSIVRSGRR